MRLSPLPQTKVVKFVIACEGSSVCENLNFASERWQLGDSCVHPHRPIPQQMLAVQTYYQNLFAVSYNLCQVFQGNPWLCWQFYFKRSVVVVMKGWEHLSRCFFEVPLVKIGLAIEKKFDALSSSSYRVSKVQSIIKFMTIMVSWLNIKTGCTV